jgi:hypothetical protein
MEEASLNKAGFTEKNFAQVNVYFWLLGAISLLVVFWLKHIHHMALHFYLRAATDWANNIDLYSDNSQHLFYLPQAAILLIPLSIFPKVFGTLIWWGMSIALYAYALQRWLESSDSVNSALFFLVSLIIMPLVLLSGVHGQLDLLAAALAMLALADVIALRWWLTMVFLLLAALLQPLLFLLVILMFLFYSALRWRILLGLIIALALPFATQSMHYTWMQYHDCYQLFINNFIKPQTFILLFVQGVFIATSVVVSKYAQRVLNKQDFAVWLYTVAALGVILLNPHNAPYQYAIVAPVLGYFCIRYLSVNKGYLCGISAGLLLLLMTLSYFFPPSLQAYAAWAIWLFTGAFYLLMLGALFGEKPTIFETKAKNFGTM